MTDEERKADETLVYYGDTIKALGDGKLGGYLIRFSDGSTKDLEGEYFASDTDYGSVGQSAVYYNHGLDPVLKRRRLAAGDLNQDEVGIWITTQLELRDEYEQAIYEMAEKGKLGWSSGTASHLVDREKDGKIVHWPLGLDASVTPTPAEPRNAAMPLKSWAEMNADQEGWLEGVKDTDAQPTGSVEIKAENVNISINNQPTENIMSDEILETPEDGVEVKEILHDEPINEVVESKHGREPKMLKTVSSNDEELNEKIDQILAFMQDEPAIKKAGYFTEDGGDADPEVKSFGDFLLAVQRNDEVRLKNVYGTKVAMAEGSGVTGGYLVPAEFLPGLLESAMDEAHVRPRATVIPVRSNRGSIPALDQQTAPTAGVGQSAWAGQARAYTTAEAAALTETEPAFKEIEFNIYKIGGYSYVSNELLADSPQSVEAILQRVFGRAIAAMEDYAFLRGTGAGMPRGILNGPASIAVSPDTNSAFAGPDALEMVSRFQADGGEPHWLAHRSLIPDFSDTSFDGAGGDMSVLPKTANVFGRPIYGYPVYLSEHVPLADASGCIGLYDMSAYGIFDREGLAISFSEHYQFINDRGTFRFTKRLDGDQLWTGARTLGGPGTAFTVSPFIYFND